MTGPPPHWQVNGVGCWRLGGRVVTWRVGSVLPARCVVCNGPALGKRVCEVAQWHPAWQYLVLPFLAFLASRGLNATRGEVNYALCSWHWRTRHAPVAIGFSLGLGVALLGLNLEYGSTASQLVYVTGGLIALASSALKRVGVVRIDERFVYFRVGPRFLRSLSQTAPTPPPWVTGGAQAIERWRALDTGASNF